MQTHTCTLAHAHTRARTHAHRFVGDPSDAHTALRQQQQLRITELLQHVASLVKIQQHLDSKPPDVLQAMPALRLDQILKHLGEVEVMGQVSFRVCRL